jgi:signal transduction histidine kinase
MAYMARSSGKFRAVSGLRSIRKLLPLRLPFQKSTIEHKPSSIKEQTIDYFLPVARAGVVAVSALIILAEYHQIQSVVPALWLFLELVLYNIAAGLYSRTSSMLSKKRYLAIIISDMLEATILVGVTGGYDSPFFPMFLFVMAELALYFDWKIGALSIITMNGLQIIFTAIQMAGAEPQVKFEVIENRFFRLIIVGLLFVILAESLRKEDLARKRAIHLSGLISRLNDIFAQLGNAQFDIDKVLHTILQGANALDSVAFSAVMRQVLPDKKWKIQAALGDAVCTPYIPLESLGNLIDSMGDSEIMTTEKIKDFSPCSAAVQQFVMIKLPAYSSKENGVLLVGINTTDALEPEDKTFLHALSIQTQLALHNAILFNETKQQYEALKSFKKTQNTFFSSAAHELKTPLTVLKVLVSTLAMTASSWNKDQREMLATIQSNVERLETLTANMLATARLEAMNVALSRQPVDMKTIAERTVREMFTLIEEKKLTISIAPEEPWPSFFADPPRARDIIANLLSNAIKFSPVGGVIGIHFEQTGAMGRICVSDAGPGVPHAERDKIFEKYYTSQDAGARAGTGLGLYIARQLALLHGGDLWFDSRGSDRTRFCFSIPLYLEGVTEDDHSDENSGNR